MSWIVPPPRWDTVAGRILDDFVKALRQERPDYHEPVTIFGSAAIHPPSWPRQRRSFELFPDPLASFKHRPAPCD